MANKVSLIPIPFWSVLDLAGNEAVNGTMLTVRDVARNQNKPTYMDAAGTIPYDNPIRLDGKGQVSGPIYWLEDEPYCLFIYDSSGNLIKTIPNYFPPGAGSGPVTTINSDINYVINGQFRFNQGTITNDKFVANVPIKVAESGWDFIKNNTSATDQINFIKFNLGDTIPEGTPIYYCQLNCTGQGSSESFKYFRFKIPDVRFASNNPLTYMLWANSTPNLTIFMYVTQHFGTGGSGVSADVTTTFASPALNSTWQKFFGSNTLPSVGSKVIGSNGDDCLYITIGMPINQAGIVNFVNVKLQDGTFVSPATPIYLPDPFPTTRGETMASQIPVPASDGSNNGQVLTVLDATSDNAELGWASPSAVGDMVAYSGDPTRLPLSRLLADGTKYDPTAKSSDNIPYSRLYNKYLASGTATVTGPQWGNGYDYLSAWNVSDNKIRVINNEIGAVSPIIDGTATTHFTFTTIQTGSNTNYNAIAYYKPSSGNFKLYCQYSAYGGTQGPGNSGFTYIELQAGTHIRDEISYWTIPALPTAGHYFQYYAGGTQYYVWFTIDGSGTDPAPGGTGILCPLLSTDTLFDANLKLCAVINQEQLTFITTVAASAMTGGCFFEAFTTAPSLGKQMAYWYKINGAGTAPTLPGFKLVEIDLEGTETNVDVANKTCIAMQNAFFQVPDGRGRFLIGTPTNNPDAIYRDGVNNGVWGDQWGTSGDDFTGNHYHNVSGTLVGGTSGGTGLLYSQTNADTTQVGRYINSPPDLGITWTVIY